MPASVIVQMQREIILFLLLAVVIGLVYRFGRGTPLRWAKVPGWPLPVMLILLAITLLALNVSRWHAFAYEFDTALMYQNLSQPVAFDSVTCSLSGYMGSVYLLNQAPETWPTYASHLLFHRMFALLAVYYVLFSAAGVSFPIFVGGYTLAVLLSLMPLYRYLREELTATPALILTGILSTSFLFMYISVCEITEMPYALAAHFAFLHAARRSHFGVMLGCMFVALLIHEQLLLLYTLLWLWWGWRNHRRRAGVAIAAGWSYYLLTSLLFSQATAVGRNYAHGFSLAPLGEADNWLALAYHILLVTAPFLWLPLRNFWALSGVAGIYFLYLLAGRIGRYELLFTAYATFVLPLVVVSFVEEFRRLRRPLLFLRLMLVVNVALLFFRGPLPFTRTYYFSASPGSGALFVPSAHDRARAHLLHNIARVEAGSVVAPLSFMPHLIGRFREPLFLYRADYSFWQQQDMIIFDTYDPLFRWVSADEYRQLWRNVHTLAADKRYRLCGMQDGVFCFARNQGADVPEMAAERRSLQQLAAVPPPSDAIIRLTIYDRHFQ